MRTISTAERRGRLARRHHLSPASRAADVVDAARDVVGLHASDPSTVYLSAFARTRDLAPEMLERALYDERSLLKILGMRRTMFVTPPDVAAVIQSACTRAIGRRERTRFVDLLVKQDVVPEPERWLEGVEARTVGALHARGEATAAELTKDVPELGTQIPFGEGRKWQGAVGVSTRLLFLLAAEGRIIRGRPRGTWVSSLYRWAPMESWTRGGLPDLPTGEAQAGLVRRWLRAFGPGTEADLRWWTGWTLAEVRRALKAIGPAEVRLDDGTTGLVLADDLEADDPPAEARAEREPWVGLLPALDATVMGWASRDWYLGPHARALFDRNGNAGPTIWLDGRVVGGWAQGQDGGLRLRLLEDVGTETAVAAEAEADRLRAWLGETRVIPRFRTPLEVELVT